MSESDWQSRKGGKERLDVYSGKWKLIIGGSPNVGGCSGCWVAKKNDKFSLH